MKIKNGQALSREKSIFQCILTLYSFGLTSFLKSDLHMKELHSLGV